MNCSIIMLWNDSFIVYLNQIMLIPFILKGALALQVRKLEKFRPTMDIDMSHKRNKEFSEVIGQIKNALSVKVDEDGIVFNPQSLRLEGIKRGTPYKGARILFLGKDKLKKLTGKFGIGIELLKKHIMMVCLFGWGGNGLFFLSFSL